jgi:hypothetical protein
VCSLLIADSSGAYAGALSLLHALSLADLDLKLEAARKILTATFMKVNAPHHFARQVQTFLLLAVGFGWFVSVLSQYLHGTLNRCHAIICHCVMNSIITVAMHTSGKRGTVLLLIVNYEVFCLVLQVATSGGSRILQNVGSHLQDYMMPLSRDHRLLTHCHQNLKFDGFL